MSDSEKWRHVAADIVVFAGDPGSDEGPSVLLVERGRSVFKGYWALPGGKADVGEFLIDTAYRELVEETGLQLRDIEHPRLQQIHAFTHPGFDPRGRVCAIAFATWISESHVVKGASDARAAAWVPVDQIADRCGVLAFHHNQVVSMALRRLVGSV